MLRQCLRNQRSEPTPDVDVQMGQRANTSFACEAPERFNERAKLIPVCQLLLPSEAITGAPMLTQPAKRTHSGRRCPEGAAG